MSIPGTIIAKVDTITNMITRDTTTLITTTARMYKAHSFYKADIVSKAWIAPVAHKRLTRR